MKKLFILAIALLFCAPCFAAEQVGKIPSHGSGSALLSTIITTLPTDASPTVSVIVRTRGYAGMRGSVKCSKAGTLTIYPLHDEDNLADLGEVSKTLTVLAGAAKDFGYSQIGAYAAKVVFVKTEAGDATSFKLTVDGALQN